MDERIRLVIVKHENCGQKYLFKVPKNESVYAGDLVLVKNKRGKTLATCLCNDFSMEKDSDNYKAILAAFGATEPLASVVGKYYFHEFACEEVAENANQNLLQSAT